MIKTRLNRSKFLLVETETNRKAHIPKSAPEREIWKSNMHSKFLLGKSNDVIESVQINFAPIRGS